MNLRALLVVLLFALSAAGADRPSPIAVMPFKNLNDDPALDWLKVGMAETMLSDLKKLAKVKVVERDQLDRALAELALQGAQGSDESTAARVGRMVGAKTIVIGGLQQAGKQLRITARFVSVETGEVLDTAKATGTLDNVFALQDEIVAKLVKVEVKKMRPVARRKSNPRTVRAYQLYALALTTASDADKVGYLRRSVEADPEFSYAVEDLARLEKRIADYAKANATALGSKESTLLLEIEDARTPNDERANKAVQLLTLLASNQKWAALEKEANRIYALNIPATAWMNPSELASYYAFLSAMMLKDTPNAMKYGERHLKHFPGGSYYSAVEMQLRSMIDQTRDKAEKKQELEEAYAKLDAEQAEEVEKAKTRKRELPPIRFMSWDFQRCSLTHSLRQFERTLSECPKYLEKWTGSAADEANAEVAEMYRFQAKYYQALAHHELGRHAEARARLEQLVEAEPKMAKQFGVRSYLSIIPKE